MVHWKYVLIWCLLPVVVFSKEDAYYFKRFTIKDGLPSPFINVLYQDSNQKLWIGTNAGLVSFNGYDFHQYSVREGLDSEEIYDIIEDLTGTLWVAGNKGVHILYKDSIFTLPWSVSVSNIEMDHSGNIWISDSWGLYIYTAEELAKFHQQKWEKTYAPQKLEVEEPNNIYSLKCDDQGNLFVSTGTAIYKVNKNQEIKKLYSHPKKDEYIIKLLPLAEDSLYWCTKEGNIYLSTNDETVPRFLVNDEDFPGGKGLQEWNNQIHLLTHFSLLSFSNNEITELNFPSEWEIKQLRCMLPDGKNNLWVGTGEGLILASPRLFHQKKYTHSEIYTLHEVDSGLLIGANHAQTFLVNQEDSLVNYPAQKVLPRGEITDIMTDFNGGLWFVSYWRGVSRWCNNKIQKFFYGAFSEEEPDLYCIVQALDSTIWLGGEGYLFKVRLDWKTAKPITIDKIHLNNSSCYQLVLDEEGQIWAGTSDGLYTIKNDSAISVAVKGLPKFLGMKDLQWIDGKLWIATQGFGVANCEKSRDGSIYLSKSFTVEEGVINNYINCLEDDGDGNIWVGTLVGLSRIAPNNNYTIHNFAQDGLTEKPYFNITLFNDNNNLMWCATSYGLFSFNPSNFTSSNEVINSHFTQIFLNGEKLSSFEEDYFNYFENSFQFNFLHINTIRPELTRYSYRLRGLDDQWSVPSNTREVKFDYLPPGDYHFEVRTGNAQGEWSPEILKYSFKILPPFWERTWFRLVAISLMLFSLLVLIQRRERGIRKKERDRSRFYQLIAELESRALRAQMNPHFIFNSMNAIQEQILLKETNAAYEYLAKFAHLMRMILNSSAKHEIKIQDEVEMLNLYLELEALRFGEAFKFSINYEEDAEFLMIPGLMVQPFVENAVWHGLMHKKEERLLEVTFQTDDQYIICMIRDNGIGRAEAKKIKALLPKAHRSQAIRLIHERLELINSKSPIKAKLEITDLKGEDDLPQGTLIKLFIPINWQIHWINDYKKEN